MFARLCCATDAIWLRCQKSAEIALEDFCLAQADIPPMNNA